LLGLFFYPEDKGDIFFRNVGWHSAAYTALYPRRYNRWRVQISSLLYFRKITLTHDCEHSMDVKGMRKIQQAPFPASAMISVGCIFDLLAHCFVGPHTHTRIALM
jgi:hypothetical protein